MRTIALIALAANAVLLLPGRVAAQEAERQQAAPKAVMELFTSQGCSSCPAADALLGKIASERKDVIAITLATDTWDYLGWKDTLSNPKFGTRQRAYAKTFRDMIYTPQAVINGRRHVNGASRIDIDKVLDELKGTPEGLSVEVKASRRGSSGRRGPRLHRGGRCRCRRNRWRRRSGDPRGRRRGAPGRRRC